MSKLLTLTDYIESAKIIGCRVAAIQAVAEVESKASGFLLDGSVKILFEPHIFSKYTNHQYDKTNPDISYLTWRVGNYGPESSQWDKLNKAISLNESAALMSASYGKFQIMGFNYKECGFNSVKEFVEAMKLNEGQHLKAFVNFILNRNLDGYLRNLQWESFASKFNGPEYKKNAYHLKMREAFLKYAKINNT